MKKLLGFAIALCTATLLPLSAQATNGDNLIGVGPISRAMGGVGVAAPQDAISATFSNPAAMCVGPFCPNSEFDFAATLFAPKIDGTVTINGNGPLDGTHKSRADEKTYLVPAFGISTPINEKLRLGLSAYGITGLGVDHRDTALSGLTAADATQLMILKVAPTIAYKVSDNFSIGAAVHVVNSQLDLDQGTSSAYGLGAQVGALYHLGDSIHLGGTYTSAINADHQNVYDLDGDGSQDDFELESPQAVGIGIAYEPSQSLLLEVDAKWLNWSDARGYDALGWNDQICVAVGVQVKPATNFALRLGYNYAENQIDDHTFDGDATVRVQGKDVNAYGFETLRIIGFPAAVEHHVTVGLGYDINDAVALNFGYMHAFKETVKSTGTLPTAFGGGAVALESELYEDAIDFSISWLF